MSEKVTPRPAGWYADPLEKAKLRHWNGEAWTNWLSNGGEPFRRSDVGRPASGSLSVVASPPLEQSAESEPVTEVVPIGSPAASVSIVREEKPGYEFPGTAKSTPEQRPGRVVTRTGKPRRRTLRRRQLWRRRVTALVGILAIGGVILVWNRDPEVEMATPEVAADATVPSTEPAPVITAVEVPPTVTITVASAASTADDVADGAEARAVLAGLPVQLFDAPTDYYRDDYLPDGWTDDDGDCQTARDEALIAQSLQEVTLTLDGCEVVEGLWRDPWSGVERARAGDVTVAHRVPLGMAHWVGAGSFDREQRSVFANSIESLVVVERSYTVERNSVNPDAWQPPLESARCRYAIDWIEHKQTWGLWVTEEERVALETMLGSCV